MEKLVIQSRNSLKENQGFLNIKVNDFSKNLRNKHAKSYLHSCFKQAIEFSEIQEKASYETRPLLQFYSLVSLCKVYCIIKNHTLNVTLTQLESLFSSHGASSQTRDDIRLNRSGTFVEFARLVGFPVTSGQLYSLKQLYERIPDLKSLIKVVYSIEGDCIKVLPENVWSLDTGIIDCNLSNEYIVSNLEDNKNILSNYPELNLELDDYEKNFWSVRSGYNYSDFLQFDCNLNLYLDKSRNGIKEILAIYLIFLKYSSLVRYKPKVWYEKMSSNEFLIIQNVLEYLFPKFWSLVTKELTNKNTYIV